MRKLLLLAVVAGILLAGDAVARQRAEAAVAAAIEARVQEVASVDAAIDSFPFLGRLGVLGEVSSLRLHLHDVAEQGINVEVLDVDARGIRLDRTVLFGESRVRVTGVDRVRATVTISEEEVRRATGADVRLLDGVAEVTVAGITRTGSVTAVDGRLVLDVDGVPPVGIPLPASRLLPCAPDVRVVPGAIRAGCTADRLPDIVVDAIGATELRR